MCGFAGLIPSKSVNLQARVQHMLDPIVHRGPDDQGTWVSDCGAIAMGHRRLSILDLSAQGHQPMRSNSGRYMIVYNGEIYNFSALRADIETMQPSYAWRGHSDTEVLLAAFELWGIDATLVRAVGMFSIAVWDTRDRQLTLARDRMGEKPLYFGRVDGQFYFASELKSIRTQCGAELEIYRHALAEYMRFGYVPAPLSIYKDIQKLQPGHTVRVSADGIAGVPHAFWRLNQATASVRKEPLDLTSDDAVLTNLHDRLLEAVNLQSFSDVPVGAFLSGGVDSSLVVSLMQANSSSRVRTFTIGFEEAAYNEAPYAREVAKHLGTEHTEMYVNASDAVDLIPSLPKIYDEPFADSSQIPTALVSRLTRQHVTVALTGDGGDELFAGYPRYSITENLWGKIDKFPPFARRAASSVLAYPSASAWDKLTQLLPTRYQASINGRRINRLGQMMQTKSVGEMYIRLMSHWQPEENVVIGGKCSGYESFQAHLSDPVEAMRQWDVSQYLADDLLVKVDRASMAASLESRAPLLDHRVVELAFSLPRHFLIRDGSHKWALRRILDRYVPRGLIDRPKAGFSIPLGDWLRGPLREWAEGLLSPQKLEHEGYLDVQAVRRMWSEHLLGKFDRSLNIWNVLMFQAWLHETQTVQTHSSSPTVRSAVN